jgi:hypothetical protein
VARRELQRKFEIVLFAENARKELKRNESWYVPLQSAPGFTTKEQWSFKIVPCGPSGIGAKKVQESSADYHSPAYRASAVALESAGVNLDICINGVNCSALEVVCPTPEIGAKV